MSDATAIHELARGLAKAAGAIQRERYETDFKVRTKSASIDLVTEVDHACEALWCRNPHPYVDGLAAEAIRRLVRWLPESADPANFESRGECQIAAWMSIFGARNTGMRLSHPMGHQIGARWDIPHGVTSCIVLPVVMRFLAEETGGAQARIAEALGVSGGAEAALIPLGLASFTSERRD